MRYTSLAVELLRARPLLVFWSAVLAQAALWLLVPLFFYASPPGDIAQVLAVGREYQVGTLYGPPLAFWLADVALRLAGGHVIGVYLLAQASFIVTFWALFALARAIVGTQHAVLAVLLTLAITAFGFPGVEFGPVVLARPLWALVLLHYWRAVGLGQRNAWFALSIEVGLLLLTSYMGFLLVGLLIAFTLATQRGRAALLTTDPLYALLVIVVLLAPYLIWLVQPTALASVMIDLPAWDQLKDNIMRWPALLGSVALTLAGVVLLVGFNSGRFGTRADEAPMMYRAPIDGFARLFVYVFALAPILIASLLSALAGQNGVMGGAGLLLLLAGLAVIIAGGDLIYLRQQRTLRTIWAGILLAPAAFIVGQSLLYPWTSGSDLKTALPASDMGAFFAESYTRRTGQKLAVVAGDEQLAQLIAMSAPSRPHLLIDADPARSPWIAPASLREQGGVVVWRVADNVTQVPDDIKARFPDIAPEVPRAFERLVQGRRPLLRVGWAIIRPPASAASPPAATQPPAAKPPAARAPAK